MPTVNTCNQTLHGLSVKCTPSVGGVKRVLLANYGDIKTKDAADGKIKMITMEQGSQFYEYTFRRNTCSATSTVNYSQENGSFYVSTDLVMAYNGLSVETRMEIMALAKGHLVCIYEDMNGQYWYMGFDNYCEATATTAQTGLNPGDKNGYDITINAQDLELPYQVDSTVIENLLQPAA